MTRSLSERIDSLSKKAQELFIICGIFVVLIIFGPRQTIPIVWPNERKTRANVIWYYSHNEDERFKDL